MSFQPIEDVSDHGFFVIGHSFDHLRHVQSSFHVSPPRGDDRVPHPEIVRFGASVFQLVLKRFLLEKRDALEIETRRGSGALLFRHGRAIPVGIGAIVVVMVASVVRVEQVVQDELRRAAVPDATSVVVVVVVVRRHLCLLLCLLLLLLCAWSSSSLLCVQSTTIKQHQQQLERERERERGLHPSFKISLFFVHHKKKRRKCFEERV